MLEILCISLLGFLTAFAFCCCCCFPSLDDYSYNSNHSVVSEEPVSPQTEHMSHGNDRVWVAHRVHHVVGEESDTDRLVDGNDIDLPFNQYISEANGGEMRKSYHGYPKGYAQLVVSPDTLTIVPMQIDTWNRDAVGPEYKDGPLPKSSRIRNGEAGYSPLLECPCSDRLPKRWGMGYSLGDDPTMCDPDAGVVTNATECFTAAQELVPSLRHSSRVMVNDTTLPGGCSARLDADGVLHGVWNDRLANDEPCHSYKSLKQSKSRPSQTVLGVARGVVNVTLTLDNTTRSVHMTLTGPATKWFGVGFGTDTMCVHWEADECPTGGPYAIIVDGDGGLQERKLDFHGPGTALEQSNLQVVSNTVHGETRIVELVRSFVGPTEHHFQFDFARTENLPLILATGCDLQFEGSHHCGHGSSHVHFLPVDVPKPICRAGLQGSIGGMAFNMKRCRPYPQSVLLDQHNPTCRIQEYRGGQSCCRHNHSLLDLDQEIPWADQPLEYRLKFRFYFEEYHAAAPPSQDAEKRVPNTLHENPSRPSHKNLVRFYWQTEAMASEYDVPKCLPNTPPSQCIHVITSQWKVKDFVNDCSVADSPWCMGKGSSNETLTEGVQLIYAAPHCHAPTCLSMELYHADTGQLLCSVNAIKGTSMDEVYNENGYLAIPPCLWSDDPAAMDEGLQPPVLLPLNASLLSIKRANATFPHTGEMASWQMRGVIVTRKRTDRWDDDLRKSLSSNSTAAGETGLNSLTSQLRASIRLENDEEQEGI